MNYYTAFVEASLISEVAKLIRAGMPKPRKSYYITAEQIDEVCEHVGERIARLGLRKAGFWPDENSSRWVRGMYDNGDPLTFWRPADFGEARCILDPTGLLEPFIVVAA